VSALTVTVPRIETARLLLREYRREDFDAYAMHHTDPVATAYTGGVLDRRGSWRHFLANAGSWVVHGLGWWAVEVQATHEFAGIVGVFLRDGWPDLEAGWAIFARFQGRGIATEAATAAIAHAFAVKTAPRVTALIDPANVPSRSVALHLGMHVEARVELFGDPCDQYVLARPHA
jgi:RimJ/RimL family protein N-acetyltransferase